MLFTVVSHWAEVRPEIVYPPLLNTVVFDVRPWQPVQDVTTFWNVTGFVGGGVQDWLRTGVPPVQPAGDEEMTVRVCVPLASHALHAV